MKLEIKDLTKSFGRKEVLKGISLEAESGKALGLLGRNGAGKTTAIRIIMGVFLADSGQILLDGQPLNRNKFKLGYLPEERGLYPKKVIFEQLMYFAKLRGVSSKEAKASINYWCERLEITEYINKKLETLSKGNQQKVQLASTLISNPEIVILDEPFSGLDPVNAMIFKDVVKELIEKNKIVLFSSHQMNYIEEFCDNIAILNNGHIIISGNIKDIKRSYDRNKIIICSTQIPEIKDFIDKNLTDIVEDSSIVKNELIVNLKDSNDKKQFIKSISSTQLDIDQFKVFEPSLNDIFVEYTEGSI